MKDNPKTEKEMIFYKLNNVIRCDANRVKDDTKLSIQEKLELMDVYLNLKRILDNYDEDIEVLRKYHAEKAEKQKWEMSANENEK